MKKTFMILILVVFVIPVRSQTLDVYWGLNWSMSPAAVDSVLMPIAKAKKIATQTSYGQDGESKQHAGYSYLIEDKGIAKIYVWYNSKGKEKVSIHSVEVLYQFEYPYDAQRFKSAYSEKYGREFQKEPELYQVADGTAILLRRVTEPPAEKLGMSIYRVSLFSPVPFEATDEEIDFLF